MSQDAQGLEEDPAKVIAELPSELRTLVESLGTKPASGVLRKVIVDLCALRWWTPRELAAALRLKDPAHLSRKHLWPLVKDGQLERRYPDNLAHPQQAYRTRHARGTSAEESPP